MSDFDSSFSFSDRDHALFEAGIKLGALYHQFIGTPLSLSGIGSLEKAIENSIRAQPYVLDISVKINENDVRAQLNESFRYTELKGAMLTVRTVILYGSAKVFASLEFDEKLNYPLMKIDKVEENSIRQP
jgi:Uncharacterized protein conserved in archaea